MWAIAGSFAYLWFGSFCSWKNFSLILQEPCFCFRTWACVCPRVSRKHHSIDFQCLLWEGKELMKKAFLLTEADISSMNNNVLLTFQSLSPISSNLTTISSGVINSDFIEASIDAPFRRSGIPHSFGLSLNEAKLMQKSSSGVMHWTGLFSETRTLFTWLFELLDKNLTCSAHFFKNSDLQMNVFLFYSLLW